MGHHRQPSSVRPILALFTTCMMVVVVAAGSLVGPPLSAGRYEFAKHLYLADASGIALPLGTCLLVELWRRRDAGHWILRRAPRASA